MISARNVTVTRGERHLIDDVSISLSPGTFSIIIGPNGAGKSTLMKVLCGEMTPIRAMSPMAMSTSRFSLRCNSRGVAPCCRRARCLPFPSLRLKSCGWVRWRKGRAPRMNRHDARLRKSA